MKKLTYLFLLFEITISFCQQNDNNGKQSSSGMISMMSPITVTIGGDFIITGSFAASTFQRLDNFITIYYNQAQLNSLRGLTKIEEIKGVSKELERYALRDITLKRKNGEIIKIDLLRFRLTGDFKYNPYLMNDDVILFPSYDNEKSVIDISGAVNKPAKFQFVSGDKLSDAILFAGGLNPSYDNTETAEISRLDKTGNKEQTIIAKIKDDFTLQSGDRIRILADENQKRNYKILVLGQVRKPGYIYINKNGMTIPEILSKADGLTENADLTHAEVIREKNAVEILRKNKITAEYENDPEKFLIGSEWRRQYLRDSLSMFRLSNIVDEDQQYFGIDNALRVLKTESLVDFTKINDPNSDESKFLVKEGDLILIPDRFDYVYVFGQVKKAGYVKYQKGKDYKYYLEKSDGLAETAKGIDETIIIKGKELNWVSKEKEKTKIEPGDFIYMPKEPPRSFWYTLSRISIVTSIIGAVVTTIYALTKF